MDSIVSDIRETFGKADVETRAKLLDNLEDLLIDLRSPMDILYIAYGSVCRIPTRLPIDLTNGNNLTK